MYWPGFSLLLAPFSLLGVPGPAIRCSPRCRSVLIAQARRPPVRRAAGRRLGDALRARLARVHRHGDVVLLHDRAPFYERAVRLAAARAHAPAPFRRRARRLVRPRAAAIRCRTSCSRCLGSRRSRVAPAAGAISSGSPPATRRSPCCSAWLVAVPARAAGRDADGLIRPTTTRCTGWGISLWYCPSSSGRCSRSRTGAIAQPPARAGPALDLGGAGPARCSRSRAGGCREAGPASCSACRSLCTCSATCSVGFDQGSGWGARYVHPASSALPVLARRSPWCTCNPALQSYVARGRCSASSSQRAAPVPDRPLHGRAALAAAAVREGRAPDRVHRRQPAVLLAGLPAERSVPALAGDLHGITRPRRDYEEIIGRRFPGARLAYDQPNGQVWRLDCGRPAAPSGCREVGANISTVTIGLATGTESRARSTNTNMPASDTG